MSYNQVPNFSVRWQKALQRLALRVSRTPLHPQWFSFQAKEMAMQCVADRASGALLDIGCAAADLRARVSAKCWYSGLDYPPTGRGLYFAKPDVYADASILPFAAGAFDCIALLDVFEHLRQPRDALCEIARVLRPAGKLFINVPYLYPLHDEPHDYQRLTEHGLRDWLQAAGFSVDEVVPRGAPIETAALLFNLAMARMVLHIVRRFAPALLLLFVLVPLVLLVNSIAWALGPLGRNDSCMPFAYWLIVTRSGAVRPMA